jgi:hypothetical protein
MIKINSNAKFSHFISPALLGIMGFFLIEVQKPAQTKRG